MKLLGHFQLLGDDGSAVELSGLRDRALLIFLALQEKSQPRERLTGLLWPDRPEAQARQSLRQCLMSLRRIGVPILSDGRDLLTLGPGLECDARTFQRYTGAERLDDLRHALTCYEGALLADWHGHLADFEEWLTLERARIAQAFNQTGLRVLRWSAPRVPPTERLFISRKVLENAPFDEAAHREELNALLEMGLRGEAVLSHRSFARRLKAELDVSPSAETMQLVKSISGNFRIEVRSQDKAEEDHGRVRRGRLCVFALGNGTGSAEHDYVCSGVMAELAAVLSRFHSFDVIAPASCIAIAQRPNPLEAANRELRADYVLEGQLEGDFTGLSLSLRLHQLADATILWSWRGSYNGQDYLAMCNAVSHAVAESITGRIAHQRTETANRCSASQLAAFDLWLRAQHLLISWDERVDAQAEELLLKATEIDPRLARAHSSLALQLNARPLLWPGYALEVEDRRRATHHARLAMDCDPHDPRSHLAMMWLSLWQCDRHKAARHAQIAYELNPHSADILMHVGLVKANLGELTTSLKLTADAIDLNPLHPDWYAYMKSMAHVLAGEYDIALATGKSIAHMFLELPGWLAIAAAMEGDLDEAQRMAELLHQCVRRAWRGEAPCTAQEITEWFLSVNRWLEGRERELMMGGMQRVPNLMQEQ